LQDYYGVSINDPDTVNILAKAKQPKKCILGTPWYNVLSNDYYKEDFAFIGADVTEREKLIEDGMKEQEEVDAKGKKHMVES